MVRAMVMMMVVMMVRAMVMMMMVVTTDQEILFEEERFAIVLGRVTQGGVRESLRQCELIGECVVLIGRGYYH